MEAAPLKLFATWSRTALIREVTGRIAAVLAPASSERVEQPRAVSALEKTVAAAGGGVFIRGRLISAMRPLLPGALRSLTSPPCQRAMLREMARVVRRRYDDAAPGTPMLAAESRDCVRAATALYDGILTEIEKADYRVLDRRVRVSKPRRLAVFARRLTVAQLARVRVTMAKPNSRSSTGA